METMESTPRSPSQIAADAEITAAIERCFITKKGITSHLIEVTTRNGVVELTGATDSLLSRRRAEEIALAVRGVRGVVNELVVNGPDVSSPELYLSVQQALADDAATRDYNLRSTVSGGMVWLTGTVRSWAEKQLALRVVEGVRGVRHLMADQLRICHEGPPKTDQELTSQLHDILDWDIRINKKHVQVRTSDRVVHLTGTVGSAAVKHRLESLAYELGATRVDGRDLFVARWAQEPELAGEEAAERPDEAIGQAVRDTFGRDPRLHDAQPQVAVSNGAVTLTGTVSNLCARRCAEHDARHVAGVREVHNQLKVRTERFWPDADIAQRMVAALKRDPYLNHYAFSLTVINGRATLHGWVNNRFEQEQAGEVASGVNGVVDVENRVALFPDGYLAAQALAGDLTGTLASTTTPPPDAELAERIRTHFTSLSSFDGPAIDVQAEKGRVTLTGTVTTWLDRQLAAREAYDLGALEVNNHLLVQPLAPRPAALAAAR
ncbi:BON domain-containing protein [Hymenobacter sp. DH14]|uniref:BON domain-containing protein n=1 Tax=Hymenobacter cyanobacteriorum TaxID=2926463 RepID=A0A9X1VI72_9BACT|nr:BON domain-containing protein [Hymenobacter cyanobacteriorum]MCI1188628.1 BON domain-containing protein [Hymenobacter cyanobacteriorum]